MGNVPGKTTPIFPNGGKQSCGSLVILWYQGSKNWFVFCSIVRLFVEKVGFLCLSGAKPTAKRKNVGLFSKIARTLDEPRLSEV
jgi:hypothetical protein